MEGLFKTNSSRDAWKGLKVLTGMEKKHTDPAILKDSGAPDRLNQFYARFDDKDFSQQQRDILHRLQASVDNSGFSLDSDLVRKELCKIKVKKAAGPDRITGKLLKLCKDSLLKIVHALFELSLKSCVYPSSWKMGEIIPVPKKDMPKVDNDLRPVTLTSILSKCLERIGLTLLMPHVQETFDPLQFAYVNGRSTSDAICTMMNRIAKHLDQKPSNTARALFIDYSSAFNTIQPHLMLDKLNVLNVPEYLQLWILDYLTARPQYVHTSHGDSGCLTLNTGAPQGCVLSPVLFVLYTNDLTWNTEGVFIIKYADDTIIVALIRNDDCSEYLECIEFVSTWCADNFLNFNVPKTKELVWDYRREPTVYPLVVINNMEVERTPLYKYLGTLVDDRFTFQAHVENVLKKVNSRMYFVRVMKKLKVSSSIIAMFYNSTISSVLGYAMVSYYELLPKYLKSELDRPLNNCQKLIGENSNTTLHSNEKLYKTQTIKLAEKIMSDSNHPLHQDYQMLPSGRRLRVPYSRTNRYKNSFIPRSINFLNSMS